MAFSKPKINSNWLLLGAALVLGVGAVYLSNALIQRRMAQLEEDAKRGQQTMQVVVANRDLGIGDTLRAEDVAIREIPAEFVHHTAIQPSQFEQYEHKRLSAPLRRGEALLQGHAEGNGANVFSATLKKGLRALTFEVDTVNSISGMLRPGDRIDLIYSARPTSKGGASGGEEITFPLMSGVIILATGQSVTKRDPVDGRERTFSTVTLEVNPLDAERIIVAKNAGRLTALLRHPDDVATNNTRRLSPEQLLGGQGRGDTPEHYVEYLVGGGGRGAAEVQMAKLVESLRGQNGGSSSGNASAMRNAAGLAMPAAAVAAGAP
jgi:pilus assembly protein CpaB